MMLLVQNSNFDGGGADINTKGCNFIDTFHVYVYPSLLNIGYIENCSASYPNGNFRRRIPVDTVRLTKVLYDNRGKKATNKSCENFIKMLIFL